MTPNRMPPRVHIFNNIRATQDTSRGRTEVFYGASSPFSVLQHLDTHLPTQESPAANTASSEQTVQDGDLSIRSYNLQSIVFDHLPDPVQQLSGSEETSYASAKVALRNFLVTALPRLPFLDANYLCSVFESLCNNDGEAHLFTADKALVKIAVGLGALPLTDLPCRQHFLAQARAEAVRTMYDINLKTVQATLIMAQFEFEAGSPNICYLHLGSAIRKVFAAGVHRTDTVEAKQTMWALFCYESVVCFQLGKHASLTEGDIIFPHYKDTSYLSCFVRMCRIVRSAHQLYHLDDTVVADLTHAKSVLTQLQHFALILEEFTGLDIRGPLYALAGENLVWHVTFSYGKLFRL